MKIAIVGSRNFCDKEFVKSITLQLIKDGYMTEFISGGAKGVDSYGEQVAFENNIKRTIFIPNWSHYGKKAGFMRNIKIIEKADLVLAFWDGKSKGTKISIDLALEKNKPINIYVRHK